MSEQLDLIVSRRKTVRLSTGRTVELAALTLRDIAQCQEAAVDYYRRDIIRVWTNNIDLLPEADRQRALEDVFERARAMTYELLPDAESVIDGAKRKLPYMAWWMDRTLDGLLYHSWLSARRCDGQKGITLDQWAETVEDMDDLRTCCVAVASISFPRAQPLEAPTANPTARERTLRRRRGRR